MIMQNWRKQKMVIEHYRLLRQIKWKASMIMLQNEKKKGSLKIISPRRSPIHLDLNSNQRIHRIYQIQPLSGWFKSMTECFQC